MPAVRSDADRARQAVLLIAVGAVGALGGCGSLVEVRSLATGRTDVAAYELRGSDLAPLRREAQRLCPQGGEILRQAGRDLRPEREDTRLRRWAHAAGEWVDPPRREAQLLVVCKDQPGAAALTASDDATGPAGFGGPAAAANAPPVGPINVEW